MRFGFSSCMLGVFLATSLPVAASAEKLRSPEYKAASLQGNTHLYSLKHDKSIAFFSELEKKYPHHPGPPLARSIAIWFRELVARDELDLERFISPGYFTRPADVEISVEDKQAFFDGIRRSQENATRYLEQHPRDFEARYYLGACQSALGVFAFTIERSFRKALKYGKESYRIQRAIVDENPDFYDAYMTVGTYEYVVGNLPWYVKWIATLAGYHGSEVRGFEYLTRAATKGHFVKDDARLLLMVMYVRENENAYALEMAGQLHHKYPENYLLHINKAQILELMGKRAEAAKTYAAVARRAVNKIPNYQNLPLDKIRYPLAQRLLALGSQDEALDQFRGAAEDPGTPDRERALSHLRAGEILDTMGRREEATAHYRRVQELPDYDGTHGTAADYLRHPYDREQ